MGLNLIGLDCTAIYSPRKLLKKKKKNSVDNYWSLTLGVRPTKAGSLREERQSKGAWFTPLSFRGECACTYDCALSEATSEASHHKGSRSHYGHSAKSLNKQGNSNIKPLGVIYQGLGQYILLNVQFSTKYLRSRQTQESITNNTQGGNGL